MSSSHHQPQEEEEEVPDLQTLENFIPTRSNHRDDVLRAINSDLFSRRHAHLFSPNFDPVSDSDSYDQMNFVTDLFASRGGEYVSDDQDSDFDPSRDFLLNDAALRLFEGSDRFGSGYAEELDSPGGFRTSVSEFTQSFINGVNCRDFEGYSSNPGEGLGLGFGFGSPTGIVSVPSTSESMIEDGDFRIWEGSDGYGSNDGEELGSGFGEELGSGFGSSIGTGSVANVSEMSDSLIVDGVFGIFEEFDVYGLNHGSELGFGSPNRIISAGLTSELGDSLASSRTNLSTDGLRVVGTEWDSDPEEVARDENNGEPFGDSDIPVFWDCLGFEEPMASRSEEFDWDEVDQRVDERDSLSPVIGSLEELSVSSEISSSDQGIRGFGRELLRSLQRELLLSVFNMGRAHDSDHDVDIDGVAYLREGNAYEDEYDTVFVHSESAAKGNPPASKSVMENLSCLVLRKEDLQENCIVCAVCKDEAVVGEKLTRLPCCHIYHLDCIVPWLCIRNTCPVCRYALPTDDLDYEQRKIQREDFDLSQDLQMLEFIHGVAES